MAKDQTTELRLIQAGVGAFGRSWASIVRATDGVEPVAYAEPAQDVRERIIADLNVPRSTVYASLAEAIAGTPADAVLITTPPETHHSLTLGALAAGKHVLLEKPLATTLSDARDMIQAAATAGRTLMVSQNYRFRPPARAAQAVVAGGDLGELLAVRILFRRDTRRLFPPGGFRFTMHHPLLLDMSIHHFDLLRAVTAREIATVYARSWVARDSPYEHDPAVIVTISLAGGATAIYDGDWAARDGDTSWNGDWELIGSSGRLLWQGGLADDMMADLRLEKWDDPRHPTQPVPLPTLPAVDRAGALIAFRDAIATGTTPETDATDNIRSLAAVLAAVQSVETGAVVNLASFLSS